MTNFEQTEGQRTHQMDPTDQIIEIEQSTLAQEQPPIGDSCPLPNAPATESTIVDIPATISVSSTTDSSASSVSYDTDSSIASSTFCARQGEHIYMERPVVAKELQTEAVHLKAERKKSWPLFILIISIIEIAIFVYDYLSVQAQPLNVPVPVPTDSVFIYRPDRRLEVWRFVSYMFLHANWFHLGFNVAVQLFYGVPLEVMHGSARVSVIYFAGVFAGSLGTSVVDSGVYLVGASGGVYALLAADLANIMLNYSQIKYAVAQLISVVIFVFCDLGYAFYTQSLSIGDLSKAPPVSYIAHLTGALAGLTIGLLVLKNFEYRAYENIIWWLALGIYTAFTVFAIVFNLINTMTAQLMEEQGEVIRQHLMHDLGVS